MSGIGVILGTALFFGAIGLLLSMRRTRSADEYSVSKNELNAWTLSSTIFATGMGVWILFGPSETLLTAGLIALVAYALSSTLSLWMFAILGKKIREVNPQGKSLVEFIRARFGFPMYVLIQIVTLLYMALVIIAELTGIGLASTLVFGVSSWQTILILLIATLSYTALGGFRASVETDKLQTFIILPLCALLVVGGMLLSGDPMLAWNMAGVPGLSLSGIEYGIALLLGVICAEAFNQVWWQRVYSGTDIRETRKGFFIAGLLVFPVVLAAGLLGLYGAEAGNYSISVFEFFKSLPSWLTISGMVLAVTLMMSSLDSFLNGMASLAMIDVKRMAPKISDSVLIMIAQAATVIFGVVAALFASEGASVLYLFLIADLICAGAAFPVFYGLFSKRIGSRTALLASIAGILVGLAFFPDPSFTRGNLAGSFLAALLVPALITFCVSLIQRRTS